MPFGFGAKKSQTVSLVANHETVEVKVAPIECGLEKVEYRK